MHQASLLATGYGPCNDCKKNLRAKAGRDLIASTEGIIGLESKSSAKIASSTRRSG
jgi:hypothetical protein